MLSGLVGLSRDSLGHTAWLLLYLQFFPHVKGCGFRGDAPKEGDFLRSGLEVPLEKSHFSDELAYWGAI